MFKCFLPQKRDTPLQPNFNLGVIDKTARCMTLALNEMDALIGNDGKHIYFCDIAASSPKNTIHSNASGP
jgi:hypothetical protein